MTLMTGIKKTQLIQIFPHALNLCCLLSLPYCVFPTSPPADGWPLTAGFWSSLTLSLSPGYSVLCLNVYTPLLTYT